MTASIFWLAAILVFSVVEAATVGLASIWFAIGAAIAFVLSFFVESVWVQVAVFTVISLAAMALIRPLAQRYLTPKTEATNADRVIGREGVVTQEIDNLRASGQVSVAGVEWTARSEKDALIPTGAKVTVLRIEGVKVVVRPVAVPEEEREESSCHCQTS